MDRTSFGPPDPASRSLPTERRRGVRQRLHTPVYVSFNGPETGLVVDLSELLDLNEYGFAVQTAFQGDDRLEANRALSLCLDLPETKNYIHGSGQVIWSDKSGKAGIRFSALPDSAQRALKEWLFTNLLVASSNHTSRAQQRAAQQVQSRAPESSGDAFRGNGAGAEDSLQAIANGLGELAASVQSVAAHAEPDAQEQAFAPWPSHPLAVASDRVEQPSALDELREQVRKLDGNPDVILQIITEAARDFTGADGAALALLTDGVMICRARAGAPAPPIGATVDTKTGLSGECVRTGRPVLCSDTEGDGRVDPVLCRTLGLRSILAVPIFADFRVAGLVEVFSPHPGAFLETHEITLGRLVELIPSRPNDAEAEDRSGPAMERPAAETRPWFETEAEIAPVRKDVSRKEPEVDSESGGASKVSAHAIPQVPNRNSPAAPPLLETPEDKNFTARNIREAIWQQPRKVAPVPEPAPRAETPKPSQAAEPPRNVRKVEAAPTLDLLPTGLAKSTPRRAQAALLISAIAVVALVLGYLLAPVIEKRWASTPPSPTSAQAAVEAPSVGPSAPQAVHRPVQNLSLEDLRKLASQGVPEAQWRLGVLYHNGEGVPQSDSRAVDWFERAASQAYVPALSALGSHYWSGRGVPQDYSQAYFWFQLALAEGDEKSKPLLEGLATQMTEAQVASARQQAEAWLQVHNQPAKP